MIAFLALPEQDNFRHTFYYITRTASKIPDLYLAIGFFNHLSHGRIEK
jgi:hypothetical protein